MFLHIRLYKDEPVLRPGESQEGDGRKEPPLDQEVRRLMNDVTTWREPRRRRTEKKNAA